MFGLWYGKGPGVDRSGDVLKHASYAGVPALGGAIALCGDDHGARSSTLAHQSDLALIHFGMPVLNPSTVRGAGELRPGRLGHQPRTAAAGSA